MDGTDISELRALARDFQVAGVKAGAGVYAVVKRGALNVKNDWQKNARSSSGRHARLYPSSISFDMKVGSALRGAVEAEIGPDKGRPQGALGNLLEYGSTHNPPHNDGGRALESEAPRFEKALSDLAGKLLGS
jgi:hypothetical protein